MTGKSPFSKRKPMRCICRSGTATGRHSSGGRSPGKRQNPTGCIACTSALHCLLCACCQQRSPAGVGGGNQWCPQLATQLNEGAWPSANSSRHASRPKAAKPQHAFRPSRTRARCSSGSCSRPPKNAPETRSLANRGAEYEGSCGKAKVTTTLLSYNIRSAHCKEGTCCRCVCKTHSGKERHAAGRQTLSRNSPGPNITHSVSRCKGV